MVRDIDHVSRFYQEALGQSLSSRSYLLLDPKGDHAYLFRPTARATHSVADKIAGQGVKRTLGERTLRICSHYPPAAAAIPMVSRRAVPAPESDSFDVAVLSNRTRLLHFDDELVYTLPTTDPEDVRTAIEVRDRIPDSINVPELLDADPEYPYFAERFLHGRPVGSPIDEWPLILEALEQLEALYSSAERELVPRHEYLDEIVAGLDRNGVRDRSAIADGIDRLDAVRLPDRLARTMIHGDVHSRNLLVDGGDVYLLDWESLRTDFTICDFLRPFAVLHYDTRDPSTFHEMITGRGRGGEIHAAYARQLGAIAYDRTEPYSGVPLLYLLRSLARIPPNRPLWESHYELLDGVLSKLD